jgi:hypothetical protein
LTERERRLCSLYEIRHENVLTKAMAQYLADRPGFPEPLANLRCGRIWDADEVKAFVEHWQKTKRKVKTREEVAAELEEEARRNSGQ